jgi:hypothetical protein
MCKTTWGATHVELVVRESNLDNKVFASLDMTLRTRGNGEGKSEALNWLQNKHASATLKQPSTLLLGRIRSVGPRWAIERMPGA